MLDHTDVVEGSTQPVCFTSTSRTPLVLHDDHLEQVDVRGADDTDHNPRLKRLTRPHVQKGTRTLTRLSQQHNSRLDPVPRSV